MKTSGTERARKLRDAAAALAEEHIRLEEELFRKTQELERLQRTPDRYGFSVATSGIALLLFDSDGKAIERPRHKRRASEQVPY